MSARVRRSAQRDAEGATSQEEGVEAEAVNNDEEQPVRYLRPAVLDSMGGDDPLNWSGQLPNP